MRCSLSFPNQTQTSFRLGAHTVNLLNDCLGLMWRCAEQPGFKADRVDACGSRGVKGGCRASKMDQVDIYQSQRICCEKTGLSKLVFSGSRNRFGCRFAMGKKDFDRWWSDSLLDGGAECCLSYISFITRWLSE